MVSITMSTGSSACRRLALRLSKAHGVLGYLQFLGNIIRHVPVSMFWPKILECLMVFVNLCNFLITFWDKFSADVLRQDSRLPHGVLGSLQFLDNFVRHLHGSNFCSMILECLVAFLDLYKLLNVHCQPGSSVDLLLQDSRKPHGVLKSLQFLENIVSHGQLRMLIWAHKHNLLRFWWTWTLWNVQEVFAVQYVGHCTNRDHLPASNAELHDWGTNYLFSLFFFFLTCSSANSLTTLLAAAKIPLSLWSPL